MQLKMNISQRDLHLLLLPEFRMGHAATEPAKNIRSTMDQDVLFIRTVQNLIKKFKKGDFELDDCPPSGRPSEVDIKILKNLIEKDPQQTVRCSAGRLKCSHTTIENNLKVLRKSRIYGEWIPHELSPCQLQVRVDVCMTITDFASKLSMVMLPNYRR